MSAKIIGEADNPILGLKLVILLLSIATSLRGVNVGTWATLLHLIAGGVIIFVAYGGFELIANAAHIIVP